MRTSKDIYKVKDKFIEIDGMTSPPENSKLYTGYNYELQEWWYKGKKDIRTLEEIAKKLK